VTVVDLATVDELLTTTRAVRRRLDLTRPVPAEVITHCVRLATQAPTAGDAQSWRWVAVTDVPTRNAIGDIYRADNEGYVRGALADADGPARTRLESVLHLIDHLHEVPVLVLAYVLEDAQLPPVVMYGSIFPAVWSFQLALRSRGLGTTPLYVQNERAVAQLTGAPENARLAALMPVAYYTGETFKPARRRPVEDVLFWDRFPS
jgi:nitroreductase